MVLEEPRNRRAVTGGTERLVRTSLRGARLYR